MITMLIRGAAAGLILAAAGYVAFGAPTVVEPVYSAYQSADGQCTGFPEKFAQWDWSVCCTRHDAGGSDAELTACLLERTPVAASPLVFLALALMAFGRPLYNLLQRWRIMK